jgi:hypothetical protein
VFIKNKEGQLVVAVIGTILTVLAYLIPANPPYYSPLQTGVLGFILIAWAGVSFWVKR